MSSTTSPAARRSICSATNYLEVSQNGATPVDLPVRVRRASNTGIPSGFDLNNDGAVGGGDDAFGFGLFQGQYGMVVLSKYPIQTDDVRTFQNFLWKDMPGALLPDDPPRRHPPTGSPRRSSRSCGCRASRTGTCRSVGKHTVHVLASHPTPPTFDGPEDRNGRRNHDEIRFWADYISPAKSRYIVDDAGERGGLRPHRFVRDPRRPERRPPRRRLGRCRDRPAARQPADAGPAARRRPAQRRRPRCRAARTPRTRATRSYDTADFADTAPGNLRADYVLPSLALRVVRSGVFWPTQSDPLSRLTGVFPFPSSDHRLVWVDVRVPRFGL